MPYAPKWGQQEKERNFGESWHHWVANPFVFLSPAYKKSKDLEIQNYKINKILSGTIFVPSSETDPDDRDKMIPETSVLFNRLTRLVAREDFINFSRLETINVTYIMFGCETWSFSLWVEHRLRVSESPLISLQSMSSVTVTVTESSLAIVVERYVMMTYLPDPTFNILPVFISSWEFQA
jgi:hypothetical protein